RVPRHHSGFATIEPRNALPAEHRVDELTVRTVRVDDLEWLDDVGFVKVDVEGHELAVLRGAERLLRRDRPTLLVECEERHHPGATAALRAYLEGLGYEGLFVMWDGVLQPIRLFADVHQVVTHLCDRRDGRHYVNNFIFIAAH
ncbi:MAG TPA: FkbM family methyltransferase, partial [Acidimicrobiales bacterium]